MKAFHTLILLAAVCVFLSGCKTEDPNPELKDPIYKDLSERLDRHRKSIDATKKRLVDLYKDLEKAEPNSIELKNARRDIAEAKSSMLHDQQLERYYKIRSERRRVMGRAAYKSAFAKGEAWPPPREYSDYLLNIRLRETQLNWNARVPKLQERLKKHDEKVQGGEDAAKSDKAAAH